MASHEPEISSLKQSNDADEEALIKQALTDQQAFGQLYRQYVDRVYRYLYSRIGNQADAEDITAQVFLEVWKDLRRYRSSTSFSAWLFTIVRRRCVDFYRRNKKDFSLEQKGEIPFPASDLLTSLINDEQLKKLTRLISSLQDDDRELIYLRYSAGLQFSEISKLLGKKESTVKMAVYRLVDQLKKGMEDRDV